MSELAFIRAVAQQAPECGSCAIPNINPFHPWAEQAVFRGKDGEGRVVEINDVVAALDATGAASEAARECVASVRAQDDLRVAMANMQLTEGTEACPPLCVKLVTLRGKGKGVDLIVPAMFVPKLFSAGTQWLTGLMDEDVNDFARSKSFGTMWRLSDVVDDAAVLGIRRAVVLAHMLETRHDIGVEQLWGAARRAVEAAGDGPVLERSVGLLASRRVLQVDIAVPTAVPTAACVKRVADGVVERRTKAAKMANAVITADRGDYVSSLDPFEGNTHPIAWPRVREWVDEYAKLTDNDADTAEILLDMLADFDEPSLQCLGPCGLFKDAVEARLRSMIA